MRMQTSLIPTDSFCVSNFYIVPVLPSTPPALPGRLQGPISDSEGERFETVFWLCFCTRSVTVCGFCKGLLLR